MKWTILDGDYYVSPTSGLDTNDGRNKNTPFKTLAKALSMDVGSYGNLENKKFVLEGGITYNAVITSGRTKKIFVCDGEKATYTGNVTGVNYDTYVNFLFSNVQFVIAYCNITDCILIDSVCAINAAANYNITRSTLIRVDSTLNTLGLTCINSTIIDVIAATRNISFSLTSSYFKINSYNSRVSISGSYSAASSSYFSSLTKSLNIDAVGFDAKFVDPANYNYNIQEGSSLKNAGAPDPITDIVTHIGAGKFVKSFNSANLAGTTTFIHDDTAFDGNSIILSDLTKKNGIFTSGNLYVPFNRPLKRVDINQLKSFTTAGFWQKFIGFSKWYMKLQCLSATANSVIIDPSYLKSIDNYTSSSDTYVRLVSGAGSAFSRQPTGNAASGQQVIPMVNKTNGLYVGMPLAAGTGIAAGTLISSIVPDVSITLNANLTASLTTTSSINFTTPRCAVSSINNLTGVIGLSESFPSDALPDSTSYFEYYRVPVNLQTFEMKFASTEAGLDTARWCKMVIGQPIKKSVISSINYGTGDDEYDAINSSYITDSWFRIRIQMHDLT
jgi:hypothetical protein